MFWRGPEMELLPVLDELGIGFAPFSPLGAGFLTGKIDENTKLDPTYFRNNVPRFSSEARKANFVLLDAIKAIADNKWRSPGDVLRAPQLREVNDPACRHDQTMKLHRF